MADAENARLVLDPRDEAADLCRADIDRRDDAAARPHRSRTRRRTRRRGVAVWGLAARGDAVQGRGATVLRGDLLHVFFPEGRGFAGAASFAAGAALGGALTRTTSRSGSRMSTRLHVAFEQVVAPFERGQLRPGGVGVLLGQQHLDRIVDAQVPAAVIDPHRGA